MSQDLLATVQQVLTSNEVEIQELVNRISSARSLDEETKDIIIKELSAALLNLGETSPELKRRVADRLENEPSTRKGGMGSGDRASLYRAKADHQDSQRKKEQEKREKIKKARERLSKAEKE